MAKAIISNRIYLDNPGVEATKKIIQALTYKFTKSIGGKHIASVETVKTYKMLPKGILSLPQARTDLIPDGYEIVDRRIKEEVPFPEPKYPLREAQIPVFEKANDTCFINALVGWGKTFTALHLAKKLGQKTLVVTHTTSLRDQWTDEIIALYGVEPGIIGGGVFDIEDHFIVVGNIQSLVKHKEKLSKEFGTIILDEAHHCPASTFTEFIDALHARYRIALSGTMIRKDGKHKLFQDYFGFEVHKPPQADTLTPIVKLIKTNITLKPGATWVDKISELVADQNYVRFVAAAALAQISKGHSVLVIADRVDFLKQIHEYIGETCVLVTGETSTEERKVAKDQLLSREKMCVAGSRQIFSEGISINILSSVILAIPMSNDSLLEQIVGRIQRPHPGKKEPVEVLDMQFAGWADKKQNTDRLGLYMKKGWSVITI
jgi:superfamily II DNA or RNA helicase